MIRLLGIVILIFSYSLAFAQIDREFWFAIPKETNGHGTINAVNNVSFKISAMSLDANVTITMPKNSSFVPRSFIVPAGQSYVEVLATNFTDFQAIYNNTSPLGASSLSDLPGSPENKGFLITSDNDISVCYDYDNNFNRELFSLKGKNALGTEFYTPFQNIWNNGSSYLPKPYSDIEIVATEDGTEVTITPPVNGVPIFQGYANNNSFIINLDRGQTFSLVANSQSGNLHPSGTHIVSDKKIAVIINDDTEAITGQTCTDIIGDQLIPVGNLGSKYLVMTGNKSTNPTPHNVAHNTMKAEQIFVMATSSGNTTVTFYGKDGTALYTTTPLAEGQQDYYSVDISDPNKSSIYIQTDDPSKNIYVFHITGLGCEVSGAIVPPVSLCNGSTEVPFYRSGTAIDLSVNPMVAYDNTIPFNDPGQSYNYFTLYYSDGTLPFTIPGSWFEPNIPSGWAVLKAANRDFNAITHMGQLHKIVNTKDYFHLGIINGTSSQGNKYKYFSSYMPEMPEAKTYEISTQTTNKIACFGDTIDLHASGGLDYNWSYGSIGGPSTYLTDPKSATQRVVCPAGNHDFFVQIHRSKCNGDTVISIHITVSQPVVAAFETDATTSCAPKGIVFTNKSTGAINYYWSKKIDSDPVIDFTPANSDVFTEITVNKTMPYNPIQIIYNLVADNNLGCSSSTSQIVTIYPEINAAFSVPDTIGCTPFDITLSNNSTGNTDSYEWNFGDQTTSILASPTHSFSNQGLSDTICHVEMIATSPDHCTSSFTRNIHVLPAVNANYSVSDTTSCNLVDISFTNQSTGSVDTYLWNFGDQSTSTLASPKHSFSNHGLNDTVYHVEMIATSSGHCSSSFSRDIHVVPSLAVSFDVSDTIGCKMLYVTFSIPMKGIGDTYLWNFGDQVTSSTPEPSRILYNEGSTEKIYHVELTATSPYNCTSTYARNIHMLPAPVTSFTVSDTIGCNPLNISFTNSSDGSLNTYLWNFGDQSTSSLTNPNHLFTNHGLTDTIYQVEMTANSPEHCISSFTRNIHVLPAINANFSISDTIGCNPLNVNFTNQSTGSVGTYLWNFGDQSTSTLASLAHSFNNQGLNDTIYQVEMTANSPEHCISSYIRNIHVLPAINANFSISDTIGCNPLNVNFTNQSTGSAGTYQWNFGDQNTSTLPSLAHSFSNHGLTDTIYHVEMTATSPYHCSSSFTRNIHVLPAINATFSISDTIGCNPLNVNFTNQSTGSAGTYQWNFGDQSTSTLASLAHSFSNHGLTDTIYHVEMTATSPYHCSSSFTRNIHVLPAINATFSISDTIGCNPLNVNFTNQSTGSVGTYLWNFGDQSTSVLANPTHQFTNDGLSEIIFPVEMSVTSPNHCSSSIKHNIHVFPAIHANFNIDSESGCSPMISQITNNSHGSISQYNWSFGDGIVTTTQTKIFMHFFKNITNNSKVYTIRLSVSNIQNCMDTFSRNITVYPEIKANFRMNQTNGVSPLEIQFTNTSVNSTNYLWSFGDETTSTIMNPVHVFLSVNNETTVYPVKLTATSVYSCRDSFSTTISVSSLNTGVTNLQKTEQQITAFPNPASDFVNIMYTLDKPSDLLFEIIEPSGRVFNRITKTHNTASTYTMHIDLKNYQSHLLFIRVTCGDKISIIKVVKQ